MEKVSFCELEILLAFGWLGIISLVGVALRFALSR
jgi:hypothetical protein